MFKYEMDYVCTYNAKLTPEVIGAVPSDIRINYYITGGEVSGPMLKGKLRPVGGDWLTIRADGVGVLDVRATIESFDGALLDVSYSGIIDLGKNGHANVLNGNVPDVANIRAVSRIRTTNENYAWVNRTQFVHIGEARLKENEVSYDVYALR